MVLCRTQSPKRVIDSTSSHPLRATCLALFFLWRLGIRTLLFHSGGTPNTSYWGRKPSHLYILQITFVHVECKTFAPFKVKLGNTISMIGRQSMTMSIRSGKLPERGISNRYSRPLWNGIVEVITSMQEECTRIFFKVGIARRKRFWLLSWCVFRPLRESSQILIVCPQT